MPEDLFDKPDRDTLLAPLRRQTPPARSEQSDAPPEDETETGGSFRATERLINQPTDNRKLLNE